MPMYHVTVIRTRDGVEFEPNERVYDLYTLITLLCDDWFGAVSLPEDRKERTQAVFYATCLNVSDEFTVRAIKGGPQKGMDVLMEWYENSARHMTSGALIGYRRLLRKYLCEKMLGQQLTEAKVSRLMKLDDCALIALAELVLIEGQPLDAGLELAEMKPVYDLTGRPVGLALP